jgi:hypothetical protein
VHDQLIRSLYGKTQLAQRLARAARAAECVERRRVLGREVAEQLVYRSFTLGGNFMDSFAGKGAAHPGKCTGQRGQRVSYLVEVAFQLAQRGTQTRVSGA